MKHGSFSNSTKGTDPERYKRVAKHYYDLVKFYKPDEVHIEFFVGRYVSHKLHMVTGAIIGALWWVPVFQDLHVGQWQSKMKWKEVKDDWKKKKGFDSEDEWAAYLMGKF